MYTAPVEEATVVVLFSCPLVDEARQPVPYWPMILRGSSFVLHCGRQAKLISTHVSCEHRLFVCRCLWDAECFTTVAMQIHSLVFEDSNGLLHRLDVGRLKDLFGRRINGRHSLKSALGVGMGSAAAIAADYSAAHGAAANSTVHSVSKATSIPHLFLFLLAIHKLLGEPFLQLVLSTL